MKHLKLYEEFESSVINIIIDNEEYVFTIKKEGDKVLLMKGNDIYQRLDIKIPDSKNLENDEFFMDTNVRIEIIDELEKQGFIQKINKESIAGDKKVIAYTL
jgi:hypothetical protein